VLDLRQFRPSDLDELLTEEVAAWDSRLHWNFQSSADLVRRFVEMRALSGFALVHADRVIGYVYYVCEERKGLIGDLYVLEGWRSVENENLLLGPVLDSLLSVPYVRRVESQLMMISRPLARTLPMMSRAEAFARNFMEVDFDRDLHIPERQQPRIAIEPWAESDQDDAARVIASSYAGHIDSRINDQYRSPAGARRFLLNIVQYPGCGTFYQPASFVATDRQTGRISGICLSSLVKDGVGHITQICVTPEIRSTGAGYLLLRGALTALASGGCTRATLTVTAANRPAIDLYQRVGFRMTRNFAAYVWSHS
jgi:ribosomal protein S18 acetylase RimI-like enzyme